MNRKLTFAAGCIYELAFLLVAVIWGRLSQCSVFSSFEWNLKALWLGTAAVAPVLAFFIWTLKSSLPPFRQHRQLMDQVIRPMFSQWSRLQLAMISVCAGVAEEALFRGAIQGSLADRIGVAPALLLASMAFGAAHLLTWTYGIIAAVIGLYLGLLWLWTGNLLTPMVAHAVYDFLALAYFLRSNPHDSSGGRALTDALL